MDNDVKALVCDELDIQLDTPDDFNYRKSGTIDSLGMVRLVLSLEKKFGIVFTDKDMSNSEFNTVGGLVAAIEAVFCALRV